MKLTNLVLHFSDVSRIFYAFYKHCCSVLIESSDPGKEVPTSIGSFGFFSSRGARPARNKRVGSFDNASEVPINTFSAKHRNPYCGKTNQPKSKPF